MPPEVQAALIGAIGAVVVATVALVGVIITNRGLRAQVREVHDHTVNTHQTNLRDDVDLLGAGLEQIQTKQGQHARMMAGLMRELRTVVVRLDGLEAGSGKTIADLAEALPVVAKSHPPEEPT